MNIPTLFLIVSAFFLSGFALAASRIPNPAPGERACFERLYSEAHLKAQPKQIPDHVMLEFARPAVYSDQLYVSLFVHRRTDVPGKLFSNDGVCLAQGTGYRCSFECDGGHFDVAAQSLDEILLNIDRVTLVACDSDSGSEIFDLDGHADGGANGVFKLFSTEQGVCDSALRRQTRRYTGAAAEQIFEALRDAGVSQCQGDYCLAHVYSPVLYYTPTDGYQGVLYSGSAGKTLTQDLDAKQAEALYLALKAAGEVENKSEKGYADLPIIAELECSAEGNGVRLFSCTVKGYKSR